MYLMIFLTKLPFNQWNFLHNIIVPYWLLVIIIIIIIIIIIYKCIIYLLLNTNVVEKLRSH